MRDDNKVRATFNKLALFNQDSFVAKKLFIRAQILRICRSHFLSRFFLVIPNVIIQDMTDTYIQIRDASIVESLKKIYN